MQSSVISPSTTAWLAAHAAARRARTPEQRRQEWLNCTHCEGAGAFTTRANDPDAREYECSVCDGTGEVNDAADWAEAVRLWNATPETGDYEKYAAVEDAFGATIWPTCWKRWPRNAGWVR